MKDSKPTPTPMVGDTLLSKNNVIPLANATHYMIIVEAFQYCTLTHPKISFFSK